MLPVMIVSEETTDDGQVRFYFTRQYSVQSYVTDHAITCVYIADSPESVREHAAAGGFAVSEIRQVSAVLDPTTGGA